jgi:ribonuclease HI
MRTARLLSPTIWSARHDLIGHPYAASDNICAAAHLPHKPDATASSDLLTGHEWHCLHTLKEPTQMMNSTTFDTTTTISGAKPENGKTRIEIYTDGACHGNPGPGGWGFVAILMTDAGEIIPTYEHFGPADGITTNNRAEMEAAIHALTYAKTQQATGAWPASAVTITSDSEILVKGFNEWLSGWIAKGWRKSNGKPVENRDLWERLVGAAEGMTVTFRWVRGHSGNRWNEKADALATKGAEEAATLGVTFRKAAE